MEINVELTTMWSSSVWLSYTQIGTHITHILLDGLHEKIVTALLRPKSLYPIEYGIVDNEFLSYSTLYWNAEHVSLFVVYYCVRSHYYHLQMGLKQYQKQQQRTGTRFASELPECLSGCILRESFR